MYYVDVLIFEKSLGTENMKGSKELIAESEPERAVSKKNYWRSLCVSIVHQLET